MRQQGLDRAPVGLGAGAARVGVGCGRRVGGAGDGKQRLPPAQRAQARVRTQEFQHEGGARARRAGDDDGFFDHHILHLRMAADEILQPQPVGGAAQRELPDIGAGERGGVGVLVGGLHPAVEPGQEIERAEIVEAGGGARGIQHGLGGERDGAAGGGGERHFL
jgi:hypothetical protein